MPDLREDALSLLHTGSDIQMDLRQLWAMEAQVLATIHLADTIAIYGDRLLNKD